MATWKKVIFTGSNANVAATTIQGPTYYMATPSEFHVPITTNLLASSTFGEADDSSVWVNGSVHEGPLLTSTGHPFTMLTGTNTNAQSPAGAMAQQTVGFTPSHSAQSTGEPYLYALSDANGYATTAVNDYHVLRTPLINTTGATNQKLVFFAQMWGANATLQIGYSTNNTNWADSTNLDFRRYMHTLGETPINIWNVWSPNPSGPFTDPPNPLQPQTGFVPSWVKVEVDLSTIPYNEDVYLYIKAKSNASNSPKGNLAICNIYLDPQPDPPATTLQVENGLVQFNSVPNPPETSEPNLPLGAVMKLKSNLTPFSLHLIVEEVGPPLSFDPVWIPWNYAGLDGNNDGSIGSADLLEFLISYGTTNESSGENFFDVNGDGEIGSADLLEFLIIYGTDTDPTDDTRPTLNWSSNDYNWTNSEGNVTPTTVATFFESASTNTVDVWNIGDMQEVYTYINGASGNPTPSEELFTYIYFTQASSPTPQFLPTQPPTEVFGGHGSYTTGSITGIYP